MKLAPLSLVIASACLTLPPAAHADTPQYTFVNLTALLAPELPGADFVDLNNAGQLAGFNPGVGNRAFLYSDGHLTFVTPPATAIGQPAALNNLGHVVGAYDPGDYTTHAFAYRNDQFADLNLGPYSGAVAINDLGQIVAANTTQGFLIEGNVVTTLAGLPGVTGRVAPTSVNNLGQVAASAPAPDGYRHLVLFATPAATPTDLGLLPGSTGIYPNALNDAGQIVGAASLPLPPYTTHAFLYSAGSMTDLGTLPGDSSSAAEDVNSAGLAVGSSTPAGANFGRAVLFSDGQIFDLNSLTPPHPDWTFVGARAINDNNQILALARDSAGNYDSFLLTPFVPEPTALLLPLAATPLLFPLRHRRHRRAV